MTPSIQSMTGFAQAEATLAQKRYRVEIKALNHRFLEAKVRLPKDFSSAELAVRTYLQAQFSRGSIEFKLERMDSAEATEADTPELKLNLAVAKKLLYCGEILKKQLGVQGDLSIAQVLEFPEVIERTQSTALGDQAWPLLEPVVQEAVQKLNEMRSHEGKSLALTLTQTLTWLESQIDSLRTQRKAVSDKYTSKITERIETLFKNFPILSEGLPTASHQTLLESRIAQELAFILDKTDIEEELVRFKGHLDHFNKILSQGGAVGRKLDFLLQELHREITTLGNKAQDLGMSTLVIDVKVRLEQLREQVMNLA